VFGANGQDAGQSCSAYQISGIPDSSCQQFIDAENSTDAGPAACH
jgi:hypothetical protein